MTEELTEALYYLFTFVIMVHVLWALKREAGGTADRLEERHAEQPTSH
jgi:hypothetical protein